MIGFLFELLLNTFACGAIFQGEFGENAAEFIGSGVGDTVLWHTQPQKEFTISGNENGSNKSERVEKEINFYKDAYLRVTKRLIIIKTEQSCTGIKIS